MTNADKKIAHYIICAQIASDSGKRNHYLIDKIRYNVYRGRNEHDTELAYRQGYSIKGYFVEKAIRLIEHSPRGMFNYYICGGPDQNGYSSYIVYFDFKIDNMRYQVSFHSPLSRTKKTLANRTGKGRKTHWVGNARNKYEYVDSRDACLKLIKLLAHM